jgi:hypothetical protein
MELASVVFVRDYVQLVFEGQSTAILTAFTWPTVHHGGRVYVMQADGYRDTLCSLIGQRLTKAEAEDEVEILAVFQTGDTIRISLRQADSDGYEAAMLTSEGRMIYVW